MAMKTYPVLSEGWLEDGAGIGEYRLPGGSVKFLPEQADYLIRSGQIGEAEATGGSLKPKSDSKTKPSAVLGPPAEGA